MSYKELILSAIEAESTRLESANTNQEIAIDFSRALYELENTEN